MQAGRVGGVLAGPDEKQGGDDEALKADDEEELSAAATGVDTVDLIGGEAALFDGDEGVGHLD